ncbi:nucleolar protein 58-like [Ochlerotatus camptorhynchus]|uniref:nucleolar protein 58-like n=1 Tax=Ochlerotatus camptorhynchus TaxID=644619 RepID=UPI0031E1324B
MKDDGKTPDIENGGANVFARSGKLQRSPASNQVTTANSSSSIPQVEQHGPQGEQLGAVPCQIFTPKSSSGKQQELQLGRTKMTEVRRKIEELYVFVKDKNNIHKEVKLLVTVIKSGIAVADRELQDWRRRAEAAEKALLEAKENAMLAVAQETPKGPTNPRPEKRDRETPGDEEDPKKHKDDEYGDKEQEDGEDNDWQEKRKKEQNKKEEKEKKNEEEEKKKKTEERKKEVKKKENPRYRRERSKGDALVIEAKDKTTYAALLRKVRGDLEWKQLGENVVKTRRTQKGEMLFELKKDP